MKTESIFPSAHRSFRKTSPLGRRRISGTQRELRKPIPAWFENTNRLTDLPGADRTFLDQVDSLVERNLASEEFEVEALARAMGCSRSGLYRKFRNLTSMTPAAFIKRKRLQKGAQMLIEERKTIIEIAFEIGFNDSGYFSRVFKNEFQCSPSAYAKRRGMIR